MPAVQIWARIWRNLAGDPRRCASFVQERYLTNIEYMSLHHAASPCQWVNRHSCVFIRRGKGAALLFPETMSELRPERLGSPTPCKGTSSGAKAAAPTHRCGGVLRSRRTGTPNDNARGPPVNLFGKTSLAAAKGPTALVEVAPTKPETYDGCDTHRAPPSTPLPHARAR